MFISFFQKMAQPIFGQFEKEEFKKFLRMGLIFCFILGTYWTIRVLKSPIFIELVDKKAIPTAKIASIFFLIPIVMIYTRMLDIFTHEKIFYGLAIIYSLGTIIFGLLFLHPDIGQACAEVVNQRTGMSWYGTKILGYAWYVFVESYGSLIVALFWAIAANTTLPESAKKGFSLVVAMGQFGGILGPSLLSRLPRQCGHETSALALFACSVCIFVLIFLMRFFLRSTPAHLMTAFHGTNEVKVEKKQETGFLEGLMLLLKHKYLFSIFTVLCIYEVIITIFEFHFTTLAATHYQGRALDEYYGFYGSAVNTVALACLLFGINNVTRILGIGFSLILMPILATAALAGFATLDSLNFLLILMVSSKAINYALNNPVLKQLYIPTTPHVRFKTQAWIETFGSRSSKGAGSTFNMLYAPLQNSLGPVAGRARHVLLSSYLGFALVIVWFVAAFYLGKTYKHAIDEKKVVC